MMPKRSNASGFSLLETFVALAILSLSLGVIYQSQSHSVRAIGRGMATQESLLRAQTLLTEYTGVNAEQSPGRGVVRDGTEWKVDRQVVQLPPLAQGWPAVTMYQVEVLVSNPSRGGGANVRLSTLDSP